MSRSYLVQEFVRVISHTPSEEIRRARVNRAEELLLSTEHSITKIAGMMGFERRGNFSEFFRKHTGKSLRAFRAEKRGPR